MNNTEKQIRQDLRRGRSDWAAAPAGAAAPPTSPAAPVAAETVAPPVAPEPRAARPLQVARAVARPRVKYVGPAAAAKRTSLHKLLAKTRAAQESLRAAVLTGPAATARRTGLRNLVHQVHEVARPAYQRSKTPPEAIPTWPRKFVNAPNASLEESLADLERGTRGSMGPCALRGIEWGVRLGLSVGGIVSLALAFVPGALLPFPALGVAVVAAAVVAGLVIGASVQVIARIHFIRRHPQMREGALAKLLVLQTRLLSRPKDVLSEQEVRQLRRIELLQADLEGGFAHGAWQVLFALTNVDPRLRVLMRTHGPKHGAHHAPAAATAPEPTVAV